MRKICENCGKEFEAREAFHRLCFECHRGSQGKKGRPQKGSPQKQKSQPQAFKPDTQTDFKFTGDYLNKGYFYTLDGKSYLYDEVIDSLAMEVAKVLGNQEMKTHQLRRVFNKARGIQTKLERDKNFEAVKTDILSLKRDTAYQVGRGVVPEEFQQFIDRNVELSVKKEKNFSKGFMQHFESVLAYFVYFFRD